MDGLGWSHPEFRLERLAIVIQDTDWVIALHLLELVEPIGVRLIMEVCEVAISLLNPVGA
jgi:hypothetical protein